MTIPFKTLKDSWMKDPAFRAEYDALSPQFAVVATSIRTRMRAEPDQRQLARRPRAKQSTSCEQLETQLAAARK